MTPATAATADLCDAHPEAVKVCQIPFRSFGQVTAFHGPIRTLSVLDDNALVRQVLATTDAWELATFEDEPVADEAQRPAIYGTYVPV